MTEPEPDARPVVPGRRRARLAAGPARPARSVCSGNGADHCCHLGPLGVCPHLEEHTVPGRRWACGLLRELGSWPAVYTDSRYQADVAPFLAGFAPGLGCGDWPPPGVTCATCAATG